MHTETVRLSSRRQQWSQCRCDLFRTAGPSQQWVKAVHQCAKGRRSSELCDMEDHGPREDGGSWHEESGLP